MTSKKIMEYSKAVELVALNESPGDSEALLLWHVKTLVSVCLVAEVYGVTPTKFAKDIIKFRKLQLGKGDL